MIDECPLAKTLYDSAGLTEFVKKYKNPFDANTDQYHREPFADDVRSGKNSPIYTAHSYHAKVPSDGIKNFIKHYTEEGDLVLDPFCGSGMTGVASLQLNRRPALIDLSPAATFIAYNYCTPTDVTELVLETKGFIDEIHEEFAWLYETECRRCRRKGLIDYVIWSEAFRCPRCDEEFVLWDIAVTKAGEIGQQFECPSCSKNLKKTECTKNGSKPVRVSYTCPRCKRQEDDVNAFDLAKVADIERRWNSLFGDDQLGVTNEGFWPLDCERKPLWFPTDLFMHKGARWGDTWRAGNHEGIHRVSDFYTKRNLWALARLWEKISSSHHRSCFNLKFCFTASVLNCSKMYRYRSSRKGGVTSGQIFIPSFFQELNVANVFLRKSADVRRMLEVANVNSGERKVVTQTASDLSNLPPNVIDYIFTDPPFGKNLAYSELNFIWESWIRAFTNTTDEAIINNAQNKELAEYKTLMAKSFAEMYRVLKPGRWMTMAFHNSQGSVWQAIQEALSDAGFVIAAIGIFDKKQRTFNQITSSGAVGYDVIVNCQKPKATIRTVIKGKTTDDAIIVFVTDQLKDAPLEQCDERTARLLHSKTIGFFIHKGVALEDLDFEYFRKLLLDNLKEIDGYWFLPYQRPLVKGQSKLFGYISSEAEAIAWLDAFLGKDAKTIGEITSHYFIALGSQELKKELDQILEENFVEEYGRWHNPSFEERERLKRVSSSKTIREIERFLAGTLERDVTSNELCDWIKLAYENKLYKIGMQLFGYVRESEVEVRAYTMTKKIADVCRIRLT